MKGIEEPTSLLVQQHFLNGVSKLGAPNCFLSGSTPFCSALQYFLIMGFPVKPI